MPPMITVTAAIVEKDGLVLAARRRRGSHLAGYWEFPGGKVEAGESPRACLKRELAEEFQVETEIEAYLADSVYDYGDKVVRLMAYLVRHLSGEFQLIDHDELRWLKPEVLHQLEWAPADIPLVERYQDQTRKQRVTQRYYREQAESYVAETQSADLGSLYQQFLPHIPKGGHILDLGCGSGRDSKAFIDLGYRITALDGSTEIAHLAEIVIGQPVVVATFQELDYTATFDGVWASASLLHCPATQLNKVMTRVVRALKPSGFAFMSFKWGEGESVDGRGRLFSNHTGQTLNELLRQTDLIDVVKLWDSESLLRGKTQRWVYAVVKKHSSNR